MRKLKKLLSDQAKDIRHRRHQINIHITLLGWVVEFFSFLLIMLGSFVLGHGNATVTLSLQTLSLFMMFNVLPCVYLVNEGELKNRILESDYYLSFLRILKVDKNIVTDEENEGCNEDNHGENKDENLVNDGLNNVRDEENEGCNEDNQEKNKDENLVNDGEIGNEE